MPGSTRSQVTLGSDTFRSGLTGSCARSELFFKCPGDIESYRDGLVRVQSPISGSILATTTRCKLSVQDPITGTTLKLDQGQAQVTAPAQKQALVHSRRFRLVRDVDVTIQTLRNTKHVNRNTNEKIGTAGTPTGMDKLQQKVAFGR